jgi:hypothetical protein
VIALLPYQKEMFRKVIENKLSHNRMRRAKPRCIGRRGKMQIDESAS